MKKTILTFLLSCIVFNTLFAQVKFGIRLNAGLCNTKVEGGYDLSDLSKGKPRFVGGIGFNTDLFLNKRLAISSGIWFTGKSVNISYTYPKTIYYKQNTFIFLSPSIYNIYYLQIPVTLKYLTHENAKGFRFYGQAGVTFDFKVSEKPKDPDNNYLYQISQKINQGKGLFNPTDISLYVGFGGEFRINSKNTIFFGLNYSQGLFDMLNDMEYQLYAGAPESLNRNLKIKTNFFGLETGIKF